MKVYIDDMLVKIVQAEDHLEHLRETFAILRRYNIKLKPGKYAFDVSSCRVWILVVSNRGIEVNQAQTKAIEGILDVLTRKNYKD